MNTKPSNPKDAVGIKKTPISCVPTPVIAEVGVAMLEGALKYGRHNYRAVGVRASVYYDATMRHLMAWWEGQDIDPGSGMSHITKAITSLVVLRDTMMSGKWEDDRPPSAGDFLSALNEASAKLVDKYADRNPKHYTIKDSIQMDFANVEKSFGLGEHAPGMEVTFIDDLDDLDDLDDEIRILSGGKDVDRYGWIENTGVKPDDSDMAIRFADGDKTVIKKHEVGSLEWNIEGNSGDITHYRVIK